MILGGRLQRFQLVQTPVVSVLITGKTPHFPGYFSTTLISYYPIKTVYI